MITKVYTFFLAIIGISLMSVPAAAQIYDSLYKASFGIIGGAGFSMHSVDFRTLPGIPSCCPQYTSGTGIGFIAGISFDYPLSDFWLLDIRATLHKQNARLVTQERKTVFDGTQSVEGIFEHSIDADIPIYAITPSIRYIIKDNINVRVGMNIGFLGTAKYVQEEILASPTNLVFSNGSSVWLSSSGEIPLLNTMQLSALTSIGYDIPLNQRQTLVATPEISYTIGFTDVLQTNSWKIHTLGMGIALKYVIQSHTIISKKIEIPVEPIKDIIATSPLAAPPTVISGSLSASVVDSLGGGSVKMIGINNIVSSNVAALVPFMFFEDRSDEIANRYVQLTSSEAVRFNLEDLEGSGTLGIYYNLLNVIGKRMQLYPDASITLTGCLSGGESEKDQLQIAKERADKVKSYLTKIWRIEPKRIEVKYRGLPQIPSNISNEDGLTENRRVEISSSSPEILYVLAFNDTTRKSTVPTIRFTATAKSTSGIEDWTIEAKQSNLTLKEVNGNTEISDKIILWDLTREPSSLPKNLQPIEFTLYISDKEGNKRRVVCDPFKVEQLFNQKERIETFSLITFNFNESSVDESNMRIIDLIKSRISKSSLVTVTGFTDRTGASAYNQKLSDRRAKEIARILKVSQNRSEGNGSSELLFDNDLPEGRFYSRTVRITIETPIEQ